MCAGVGAGVSQLVLYFLTMCGTLSCPDYITHVGCMASVYNCRPGDGAHDALDVPCPDLPYLTSLCVQLQAACWMDGLRSASSHDYDRASVLYDLGDVVSVLHSTTGQRVQGVVQVCLCAYVCVFLCFCVVLCFCVIVLCAHSGTHTCVCLNTAVLRTLIP